VQKTTAQISFPISLSGKLQAEAVHYVAVGEPAPPGCAGGTVSAPKAARGNLCVYAGLESFVNAEFDAIEQANGEQGAQRTGATVAFLPKGIEINPAIRAQGTWAVTG
jgi:hypothetical protein